MVPRRSRDHPQAPRRRRQRRPRRLHELLQEPLPQRTPPQPLRPGHHRRPQPRRMTGTPRNEAPFRKTHPIVVLVSTNKGDSFDYESTFTATELRFDTHAHLIISNSACCYADKDGTIWQDLLIADSKHESTVVHVTLPIGLNVQG